MKARLTAVPLLAAAFVCGCAGGDFCSQLQSFAQKNSGCASASAAGAGAACETYLTQCSAADKARLEQYAACLNQIPACSPVTEQAFAASMEECASLDAMGLSTACPFGLSAGFTGGGTSGNMSGGSSGTSGGSGTSGSSGTSGTTSGAGCAGSPQCASCASCPGAPGATCVDGGWVCPPCGCSSSSGGTSGTSGTSGMSSTSGASGTSGSTSGGTSGNTSSSSSGGTPKTFCDGFLLQDETGSFLVQTYAFDTGLSAGGCYTAVTAWADGQAVSAAGGILDVDVDDNAMDGANVDASQVVFAGSCPDLGLPRGGQVVDGNGSPSYTPPVGAQTVAQVMAAHGVTGQVYGVVTAVKPWTVTPTAKGGTFYIQDPVASGGQAQPESGILVYVAATTVTATTPAASPPNVGDVVSLTGFTWSPYTGKGATSPGYANAQMQLASAPGATLAVVGTSPLPPPVTLSPEDASPNSTSAAQWRGMRVEVQGSFQVEGSGPSNTCPSAVKDISGA